MSISRWKLAMAAAVFSSVGGSAAPAAAQEAGEGPAITARVHGTFTDKAGGAGVLSGDMFIVGFELRNGGVTAIGRISGALADSAGGVLGLVDEQLAIPVGAIDATCNQLRMDLAATDAVVLNTPVHFEAETGGFDSRDGATPKALRVLCTAADALRAAPAPATRVTLLNDIVAVLKAPRRGRAPRD